MTHNPFRNPAFLTPNPTGASALPAHGTPPNLFNTQEITPISTSASSLEPVEPSGPASPQAPPPPLPPRRPTQSSSPPSRPPPSQAQSYSPPTGPPPSHPQRHYAPPPGPPPTSHLAPTANDHVTPPPAYTPSPSFMIGEQTIGLGPGRAFQPAPDAPSFTSTTEPQETQSAFVRDFYAAGADVNVQAEQPQSNGASGSGGGGNDGVRRPPLPTNTPTPGHPFLNDGKMLVYPRANDRRACRKCSNTGYKLPDPIPYTFYNPSSPPKLSPCRRCWSKYGKTYNGALGVAYFNSNPAEGEEFQRALPHPPRPPSRPPPAPAPAPVHVPRPSPQPQYSSFMGPGAQYRTTGYGGMPGGNAVMMSGDPRLGGQLCWRCHGAGTTSDLLFGWAGDRNRCALCNGVGRTFR